MADYMDQDNARMVEYLTLIYTENTRTQFLARVRESEFKAFKPIFDNFVATAVVQ